MTTHGPIGQLAKRDDVNVITFDRTFPVSPERLWRALTTPDGIMSWLAPTAAIDAREGGAIEMTFDEENVVRGVITEYREAEVLAHTWVINDEVPSELRYELTPVDGGTLLHLEHAALPDEMCGGYTPGWHAYLVRLDAVLADEPPPAWFDVFEQIADAYR